MNRLEFLQTIKGRQNAAMPVVVMTAFGSVETAVEAMKAGAAATTSETVFADRDADGDPQRIGRPATCAKKIARCAKKRWAKNMRTRKTRAVRKCRKCWPQSSASRRLMRRCCLGGERRGEGLDRARHSREVVMVSGPFLKFSTAPRSPEICWRANCSASKKSLHGAVASKPEVRTEYKGGSDEIFGDVLRVTQVKLLRIARSASSSAWAARAR